MPRLNRCTRTLLRPQPLVANPLLCRTPHNQPLTQTEPVNNGRYTRSRAFLPATTVLITESSRPPETSLRGSSEASSSARSPSRLRGRHSHTLPLVGRLPTCQSDVAGVPRAQFCLPARLRHRPHYRRRRFHCECSRLLVLASAV